MIRPLAAVEFPPAAALAAAALREDPGFSFILPDDAERRARLPTLLLALLHVDAAVGGKVSGAFDGEAMVGVSSVMPAGVKDPGLASWLGQIGSLSPLFMRPAALMRASDLARAVGRLRPLDHAYLHIMAVHPACQGRGIGAALLRDAAAGGKVYLETFLPENRAWYAARGLREHAEVRAAVRPAFWTFRS